ncbi:MAG TPA: PD-(D/E)XK nuclease family protein, partial [Rhodanobacteraceae bacterium]|nr:PD-(D/E)XK nuclease family protein [Rhodanobacteraceae bacterium]
AEHAGARNERATTIVVSNALAAQQWELHLAAEALGSGLRAWETPPLSPYAAWLDEVWLEHAGERGPALSTNQSLALWRRVVAESAESGELIGHAGAAQWAAAAWGLLHRWQIDPTAQRAGAHEVDYRAFLSWCRAYRAWLDGHGFVDRAEIEASLPTRVGALGRLQLADLEESYPARTELLGELAARGTRIETLAAPAANGIRHAARLADAADELRAAFAWAAQRLAAGASRVALVVSGAARRAHEIERLAAELPEAPAACWIEGRTSAVEPVIGAAVESLALAGAHASHASFGRWLRSPFFASAADERIARARLDAELRAELRSQLPFEAAYRSGVADLLATRAPASARALAAARAVVGGIRRATPSRWGHLMTRFLAELGWQPPSARAALLAWQSTFDELARLTPIVGEISLDAALRELGQLLERATRAALSIRGVHVLARVEDVGPGYDAVWVTGFTDAAWPQPPLGIPLLPVALQRTHGMPYSSPRDAQQRSARALGRLVARSRELVVSWPARVYDYDTEPSPAIRDWPVLSVGDSLTAARPLRTAARETVTDDAPPLAAARVPGGTGALGRQARCPLRAFYQDRLGARPLEALAFGVPARLRGIAAHRAAERLLGDQPAQADFAAKAELVAQCVERALASMFGRARGHLRALYELEAEQLERALAALLRADLTRAPFRVRAVEQRATATIGPLTFDVRIDRVDELADGTLAIVDYKTNERATSAEWFGPRLRDAQVPLYASQSTERVGAAVVARLTPAEVRYFGFWPDATFPGRAAKAANPSTEAQLATWRTQLTELAGEIAAGDTRIFVDDFDDAKGPYAPLTRVFEQLAVARGSVPRW